MIFLLLSVVCSVVVSVLLKMARRYRVDVYQAIMWGYPVAAVLTLIFFRPTLENFVPRLLHSGAPLWVYAVLAILLPSIFAVLAFSVQKSGIVRTDVAQRLSLLISLIAAFYLFGEIFTAFKLLGIVLGLAAILLCIHWEKSTKASTGKWGWVFLLGVFFGFAAVDICFKIVAQIDQVPYFSSLLIIFVLAAIVAALGNIAMWLNKKLTWSVRGIAGGLVLGLFNFGNILFYVRGHQALSQSPALVFTAMNIGVVVLGAIVGLVLFKEKLSKPNLVGVGMAILAIFVIVYGQLEEQKRSSIKPQPYLFALHSIVTRTDVTQ